MRPFRLARIAAEAEGVRLRGMMTRMVTRVILAVIALVFMLGAAIFAHIAAWFEIRTDLQQSILAATGILGGADLVVAIILIFLASRSSPSRTEVEALDVRRKAIAGIGSAVSLTQMVVPAARLLSSFRRRRA